MTITVPAASPVVARTVKLAEVREGAATVLLSGTAVGEVRQIVKHYNLAGSGPRGTRVAYWVVSVKGDGAAFRGVHFGTRREAVTALAQHVSQQWSDAQAKAAQDALAEVAKPARAFTPCGVRREGYGVCGADYLHVTDHRFTHTADCWELATEDGQTRDQALSDLALGNTPCICADAL